MRIRSSAHLCSAAAALAVLATGAQAESSRACSGIDYNAMILEIIKGLPTGGGYSTGADFMRPRVTTHNIGGGHWELRVYDGFPSHCTSATYALFSRLVATLHNGARIHLTPEQLGSLDIKRRMPDGSARLDGQGPFAIFNSNGAGVAAFLKHTGTGFSFRDDKLGYARPGDFLKLFWNQNVGATERGHQVVYTGRREVAGRDMICFWSSQRQNRKRRPGHGTEALYFPATAEGKVHAGYGEVCRPRSDIKAMIFSRVTCMEHLAAGLDGMAARAAARGGKPDLFVDEYLYYIRTQSSDHATLDRMYGIVQTSLPAPVRAPVPVPAAFADSGIAPLP